MCVLPACIKCTPHILGIEAGQGETQPQELELCVVASHHVGVGNRTQSFAGAHNC